MNWMILVIILLNIGVPLALANGNGQTASLAEAVELINNAPTAAKTPDLVAHAIEIAKKEPVPSIADDLALLLCVENYDISRRTGLVNTNRVIQILGSKYQHSPEASMELLIKEMALYRSVSPDPVRLAQVAEQADATRAVLQSRQTIASLTELVALGETYLALPGGDRPGATREKARGYLTQAVDFPIFATAYSLAIKSLRPLYVKAVVGLVGITDGHNLSQLRVYPFARPDIEQVYTDKAKRMSRELPGMGFLSSNAALPKKSLIRV